MFPRLWITFKEYPMSAPSLDDPIMTIPEVAKYLKISKAKIYYMVQRNDLPHIRIDRNVRVLRSDLISWLQAKKNNPSQLAFLIDRLKK